MNILLWSIEIHSNKWKYIDRKFISFIYFFLEIYFALLHTPQIRNTQRHQSNDDNGLCEINASREQQRDKCNHLFTVAYCMTTVKKKIDTKQSNLYFIYIHTNANLQLCELCHDDLVCKLKVTILIWCVKNLFKFCTRSCELNIYLMEFSLFFSLDRLNYVKIYRRILQREISD